MKVKTILFILIVFCFQKLLLAEDKVTWDERLIGATFKSLAKAFVTVVEIKDLKENNIKRLKKIDDEKFRKQYAKVYPLIKELPPQLKKDYGITERMARDEAIKNTRSLNKQKIYEIIDAIPDRVIAQLFKDYLSQTKQNLEKNNLIEQIKKNWHKITEKATGNNL